ncbi:ribokinase [Virgibacillus halodenitrificans]|uniref:ribokinase n=1 Tax=Virgibacillus halodenitrificans TaxID=1482 RepID=UPI001FB2FD3A|nr:ribokinase [Virgibacillus halodenitrificans]MCJ0932101.1 ribokinase [Virgibacillus halodenitrificans]
MKKVVVLGSLNMDLSIETNRMPRNGETIDGKSFFMSPGGKGANQAVAAQKSGAPTSMIGSVGNDLFGSQLISSLKKEGVDCTHVMENDSTSTGIAMIIRNAGDNRIILGAGANYTVDEAYTSQALQEIANKEDIFLTQFESDYEVVLHSLAKAKSQGLFTVFNPAPAKDIPETAYPSIDLLIVNQWESEMLSGIYPKTDKDCEDAIKLFLDKGVSSVIITCGAAGSTYGDKEQLIFVPSFKTNVVDTTAAGDTYIGALVASLANETAMKDSMIYATKAASLAISKQGAQESIPYKHEIDQFKEVN